jgi:hypothetical protein
MNTMDRKGEAPTAEEFFDHCLTLADTVAQNLLATRAIQNETKRALDGVNGAHAASKQDLDALARLLVQQGATLQGMYAPAAVSEASMKAAALVASLETKVNGLTLQVEHAASATMGAFSRRAWVASGMGAMFLLVVVGLVWRLIPSLDEIKTRRAERDQLDDDIAYLTYKSIDYEGVKWIRVDGNKQTLCVNKVCTEYVKVH